MEPFLLLWISFQLKGISAFPVSEDMMEWEADIEGLENTIWHGMYLQSQSTF